MISRAIAGSAVLLVLGVAGTVSYFTSVESATVDISVPAWKLESWTELHGAPTGGQLQTQRQEVTLTETATGTATGAVGAAGSYASGYVVVTLGCLNLGPEGCPNSTVLPGAKVCRVSNVCYQLMGVDACFCAVTIPILALYPGASFNSPAGTVNMAAWPKPGYTTVSVTNPAPITGGIDAWSSPVVTRADIDSATNRVRAQLSSDLQSAAQVKAGLAHVVADAAPTVTVTSDVAAGARAKTFQVTATGTLGVTVFQDSDAQNLIAHGMDRWVPAGFRLNGAPVVTDYRLEDATKEGDITVAGKATDYLIAKFSADALRLK